MTKNIYPVVYCNFLSVSLYVYIFVYIYPYSYQLPFVIYTHPSCWFDFSPRFPRAANYWCSISTLSRFIPLLCFLPGVLRTVMVSIRRRKLLGLCSGVDKKPVGVHPLPLNDGCVPKEETTALESASDLSSISPSKEHLLKQLPEVKCRKRHRRKHVENQEACMMRGVYYKNRKWQAAIKVDKKQIHLGTVGSEEEAARLYDRAAFMCGREPNFELSEEEKEELRKYKWDEFLAITRSAITNKKGPRNTRRKPQNNDSEGEQGRSGLSASDDDTLLVP